MGRRRQSGAFEDLVGVLARLPWWACIAVGVLSYAVLHRYAVAPPPTSVQPGQLGEAMAGSLWRALAMAGQYVVPLACGIAR